MGTKAFGAIIGLACCIAPSLAFGGTPTPLFSSDEVLNIEIEAPFNTLARKSGQGVSAPGVIRLDGGAETRNIMVSPRGNSRRDKNVCAFPPLSVTFVDKPEKNSLFHKQKKLKLVAYCNRSASFQKVVLREYAAYRLFNAVTEESFRVRLAEIAYVEEGEGKAKITRKGFFIEDADDLARRVGLKEVDRGRTPIEKYDREKAARTALFQYMIGNLDWDITAGPSADDCCHNGKILGAAKDAETGLTPAPYDFDMSGFVDAPYSAAPESLNVRSVKDRLYRGFCSHNAETMKLAAELREKRSALEAVVLETPGLAEKDAQKAVAYLGGFFDDIATDDDVEKNLLKKCRG